MRDPREMAKEFETVAEANALLHQAHDAVRIAANKLLGLGVGVSGHFAREARKLEDLNAQLWETINELSVKRTGLLERFNFLFTRLG